MLAAADPPIADALGQRQPGNLDAVQPLHRPARPRMRWRGRRWRVVRAGVGRITVSSLPLTKTDPAVEVFRGGDDYLGTACFRGTHSGAFVVELISASEAMRQAIEEATLAARFDVGRVLIAGEAGVGKHHLARFIHQRSSRRREPFLVVSCAALARAHVESGVSPSLPAEEWLMRALRQATRGTLFLKGVQQLTPPLQSALMQLLEIAVEHQRVRTSPVRIICSAPSTMCDRVHDGAFPLDLYYRLNTIYLPILPLRERPEDVEPLLRYFVRASGKRLSVAHPAFRKEWQQAFDGYDWPGNVRELRTVAESIVSRSTPLGDIPSIRTH
jgi:DNA-binding NtrC family response regulator